VRIIEVPPSGGSLEIGNMRVTILSA